MGPLYSAAIMCATFATVCGLCFCVARIFLPTTTALRLAIIFPCGATFGGVLALLALGIFFGQASAIQSGAQIGVCVALLALGLIVGGAVPSTIFLRHELHATPHPLQAELKE